MKHASRDKIAAMDLLQLSADELISALLSIAETETVCILDSCGVGHLGSHFLIAGIEPLTVDEISHPDAEETLAFVDGAFSNKERASIFTLSYEFGRKLIGIGTANQPSIESAEPDLFLASFGSLIVHDYGTGQTRLRGKAEKCRLVVQKLKDAQDSFRPAVALEGTRARSNFSKTEYLAAIGSIKECIRQGDTYQTNLTQQMTANLSESLTPEKIYWQLRRDHPAPFSAFIKRNSSTVVSASPERFFHVENGTISASPIKGTRPRGLTPKEDLNLRYELTTSRKDIAENTMIVDLLRNDLGRVCEFGSVNVDELCELEEHPTLFHLVSTISGRLRPHVMPSEILRALFPCGSITGAPKISTMRIIDAIETVPRGLSMGAIGYCIPSDVFSLPATLDLSVAIRTMVIRDGISTFNVGGGIVIDSDPEKEYEESLTKARALLTAIGAGSEFQI